MANTLTNLIPEFYGALALVSRELVGFIPGATRDTALVRGSVGQTLRWPVAPAAVATDITPGVTPPNDGDQTIGSATFSLSKSRRVPFRWAGEESRGLNNGGPGRGPIQVQQLSQALRTLCNEMEVDLAVIAATKFSRAFGTAAATPFATNTSETAQLKKILDDNGAPQGNRHLVINTTAGVAIRSLSQLTKVNEAGTPDILTQGRLINLNGFDIRESDKIQTSVAGTAASATTNAAGYAVGATTLTLASAGTGTLVAGDIVTFAGDTNKYLVVTGDADVSNGGTFTIQAPGLRVAMSAATKAITVVAAAARNAAFHQSSLLLGCRLPALPDEGDMAVDRFTAQDPISGLVFEVAQYNQYRQVQYEVAVCWGVGSANEQHTALLLG